MKVPVVEVCAATIEVASAAEAAGADRIELNSALELDGLTPSPGLVDLVLERVKLPVIAMLRPRAGDFVYSESEWSTMLADLDWMLQRPLAGIAFGCLDSRGVLARERIGQIQALTERRRTGFELVFHRAFDDCREARPATQLAELGVHRVMTSGGSERAEDGLKKIRETVEEAAGRIEVIPASGIHVGNVPRLLETGCGQIHGTYGTRTAPNPQAEIEKVIGAARSFRSPSDSAGS